MAFRVIEQDQEIQVKNPPVLIYGEPWAGKTSLAQTAENPITLDFDRGIQRSQFRKRALDMDTFADAIAAEEAGVFKGHRTIVVDTVGHMLDSLSREIIGESGKFGSLDKGLFRDGWTLLKNRFAQWVNRQRAKGFQIVLLAHEKEDKEGEKRFYRPAITGGSYAFVMQMCDVVGSVYYHGRDRAFDCCPSDMRFGKNPAKWPPILLPNYDDQPLFLQGLIVEAAAALGKLSQSSAQAAKAVGEWRREIESWDDLDKINARLKDLSPLVNGVKKQVWHMLVQQAARLKGEFDRAAKKFVPKEEENADKEGACDRGQEAAQDDQGGDGEAA